MIQFSTTIRTEEPFAYVNMILANPRITINLEIRNKREMQIFFVNISFGQCIALANSS